MSRLQDAIARAVYHVLNNFLVEAPIVAVVGVVYVILRAIDHVFRTHLRMKLVNYLHDISRDTLSPIRKAQIRYLFKRNYNLKKIRIRLAGGSYWMSIPCTIEGIDRKTLLPRKYLGKIINDRSALKHRYMTALRRLGVLAEGAKLDFIDYLDAKDMVDFERDWMVLLKQKGVCVPEVYGVHRLNHDDYILVMEFIEGQPLSKVRIDDAIVNQVFSTLKTMHETGVFHGDLKLDNLICANGQIYVIDCMKINPDDPLRAHEFDLACAILALAQEMPVDTVLKYAEKYHPKEEMIGALELLGVALNKAEFEVPLEKIEEIRRALSALKIKA
jgi:predicted Ser/Thr protein kinase